VKEREREREGERDGGRRDRKGRKNEGVARKKARTHVNIAKRRLSGITRTTSVQIDVLATDYEIPLHFVGKISTCHNDLCWNAVGSESSRYVILFTKTIRFETTVRRNFIRNTNYLFE